MTPILFYGVPEGCSFGSIVALEWLGEPYRLSRINMPEETGTDAYGRINAVRETPSLMTADGRFISESMAILSHLNLRFVERGRGFLPGTPGFDRFNQTLAFLNTTLFASFAPYWFALEHESAPAAQAALQAFGREQVRKAHAAIEAMLSEHAYLLGDEPSLADAYFVGVARWNDFHRVVDRADYPRLADLYERIQADPAVRFAHAIEEGEEPTGAGGFQGHVTPEAAVAQAAA